MHRKGRQKRLLGLAAGLLILLLAYLGGGQEFNQQGQEAGENKSQTESSQPEDGQKAKGQAGRELDLHGSYTSKEDVALFIYQYGRLPDNFISKKEARALGWEGGSLEAFAPGKCIGGDRFGNYEGALPKGNYQECDIDTLGADSRGGKRLVFEKEGKICYTEDHYKSFELLYDRSQK